MIREFYEDLFAKLNLKIFFAVISMEKSDEEIKQDHFHGYVYCEDHYLNIVNLDIQLKKPVAVFYHNKDVVHMVLNENINGLEQYKLIMETWGATNYKVLTHAHPNIKFRKNYGSSVAMIEYVIKQRYSMWSTADVDAYLLRLKTCGENKKGRKREPDWALWKLNGMTLKDVLLKLKNDYPAEMVKNYHRWSAGIHMVFGRSKEDFLVKPEREYWIPLKVYDWCMNVLKPFIVNSKNKKWLIEHRMDRPTTLIWEGPSQIGKTSFFRSLCDHNYYQFRFDGMEDFEEDFPLIIIDDFAKEITKYFPDWKCWLGGQTNFAINPKFGRRRKIDWGHPCVFLTNYKNIFTEENGFNSSDLEYIKKNCIHVVSDKRELWKKPSNSIDLYKYIKINIGEFRNQLLRNEEPAASPAEREYQENIPILINDIGSSPLYKKRPVWEQPLNGRLIKKIRRTGSGSLWY